MIQPEPDVRDDCAGVEVEMAAELRRHRQRAGLSVGELAIKVGYSREHVSKAERPGRGLASRPLVEAIDAALDAGGALRAMRENAERDRRDRRSNRPSGEHDAPSHETGRRPGRDQSLPPEPDTLAGVVALLGPGEIIDVLEGMVESTTARYELDGPRVLIAQTREARRLAHRVAAGLHDPLLRGRAVRVAARQAAQLAYMAANLGRYREADRHAWEATVLAAAVGDLALQAWVAGVQSFGAYYEGRYRDALTMAMAGVRLTRTACGLDGVPGQRIRLLSNGVARAAAKLGERRTVEAALGEAFQLVEELPGPAGMTSCIAFHPYGWTRTAANAATAYLALGEHRRTLELVEKVSGTVEESDSDWSRSLIGLDRATAFTLGRDADVDHATAIGISALAATSRPIASIDRRAADLATALTSHLGHHAGDEFIDALHIWRRGEQAG